jgi:hypothetical protein
MNKRLGVALAVAMLLMIGCKKKEDGAAETAPSASAESAPSVGASEGAQPAAATGCPAGSTEGTGMGFCIKLPEGFKFEKIDGDTISFVNDKYDRISIDHDKEYQFENTPEDFKSMTANKTPTSSGVLLEGKGGWALLDDGKVALGSVRINHPKGGMLTWKLSTDSASGKVQSYLESVKTITLL